MAEASNHHLYLVEESTRGTTPTSPLFHELPDSRNSLSVTLDTLESSAISGDRFPDAPRTGATAAGGDIPTEYRVRDYDPLIESALQGVFTETGGTDTVDLTQDATPHTGQGVGDDFTTSGGEVQILRLDAKAQTVTLLFIPASGTSSVYYISGLNSATIDSEVFTITAYTDAAETAECKAGDTRKSFTMLRWHEDIPDDPYLLFRGMEVSAWNLSLAGNALVESTYTMFGQGGDAPAAAAPSESAFVNAESRRIMDTFSGSLEIDSVAECVVTEASITVENGHASRYFVGCSESGDPSVTQSVITGSLTLDFVDAVMYKKFFNEEFFALKITLTDPDGNSHILDLPKCIPNSGTEVPVTEDGPVSLSLPFSAHKDDTLGTHFMVTRSYPLAP